ncbi:hypothetical protein L3Q82_017314 [Scortum barcoo]|uniref:Uncharacterized protein n=1 Tax=Scortum barcoo TaxID=214431 RepID=A0ACB8VK86_9TELE|nr:hypothetical protein L3Q82_017314 [Scortum barcoo]
MPHAKPRSLQDLCPHLSVKAPGGQVGASFCGRQVETKGHVAELKLMDSHQPFVFKPENKTHKFVETCTERRTSLKKPSLVRDRVSGGSSLSRDAQTSLTPDTSSSSSGGSPRRSQASPRDIVSQRQCPGSSPRPPPGGTRLEHLPREASQGASEIAMPKPPQLTPLDAKEQRLYSELLPNDRASHPISKGAPSHPAEEETHFGRLYHPRSCPFRSLPKVHDHR